MIVFGGRNQTNIYNDVAVFDLLANKWIPVTVTGTPPAPRAYHTAVVDIYQHLMYIYGGANDDDTFDDMYTLDLDTYTWLAVIPTSGSDAAARAYHSAVLSPLGTMVVFGGVGSSNTARGDVACFNLVSLAWSDCLAKANPAPGERWGHTAVVTPLNKMLVYAGKNSAGT